MNSAIEFIQNNIFVFDLIVFLTIIYYMAQCATKGFTLSLFSFSKWLIALVITIYLVPKLNSWIQDYIEISYYSDIGLGIFIFIVSLFLIINLGKLISSRLKWSGLGGVDRTFGSIFGIFKGGLICVCVFTLVNWFYPHQKWTIATKDTISFQHIYEISEILVEKFPNREDYYNQTVQKCHETVGVAILNTSITIVFGFSILVLSNFIPTIYFGVFTGIAMLLAMISVLILLPKLILIVKPFGNE